VRTLSLILWIMAVFWPTASQAEPRFALRMGVTCNTCHINPTGGGARTTYGRTVFEAMQLPMEISAPTFDPTIADKVAVGADFRLAYLTQFLQAELEAEEAAPAAGLFVGLPSGSAFFPMQADLYVNAAVHENVTLYTDIGAGGSFEVFGLAHDLPLGSYIKVGFFMPPYGWKIPNHSAAHRQPIGWDPRSKDAGVEVGLVQPWLELAAAVQNGETGGSPLDSLDGKSASGRAAFWLKTDPINLVLGGSVYRRTDIEEDDRGDDLVSNELRTGPFIGAAAWQLQYLAEADWRRTADGTDPLPNGGARVSGTLVTY